MPPRDSKEGAQNSSNEDFESVAKRLECDEDKERFERSLHKIAKAKPKTGPKPRSR
jgi:hypothetical protein